MTTPKDPTKPSPDYTLEPVEVYDDEGDLPEDMVEVPMFEEVKSSHIKPVVAETPK